jgi:Protein of unknown function (DUF2764)
MTDYYFLASLLPSLEIGHVPALGFPELKTLMNENLTRSDLKKVATLLSLIDLENIRAFWVKEPLDPRGNFNEEQIAHALMDHTWPTGETFAPYLSEYLEKYRTNEERLLHFPLLMSQFFTQMIDQEKGFLRDYFAFQREMRLVMVGFRAKKMGRDLSAELQYEDPTDPIVAQILAQKDAKTYEPPFEYKELRPIFEEFGDSPLELYKAIYTYQFNHIVELWGTEFFSVDRILNYAARLILVERWLELNVQKGIQVVDTIEKEIS